MIKRKAGGLPGHMGNRPQGTHDDCYDDARKRLRSRLAELDHRLVDIEHDLDEPTARRF
jgi:hypothetical protein